MSRDPFGATIVAISWLALAASVASVAGCSEGPGVGTSGAGSVITASGWGAERRVEASDSAELDQFGYSVSLAGNRALVGAYGESLYAGAAYVYSRNGAALREEQKLFASDAVESDSFGWSVSLGVERLLIGAYGHDSKRGAAYVFVRDGDSWSEEQKLVASDGAEGDAFGWSVSLSDDDALIGAYGAEKTRGAAYVFRRIGGAWVEEQKVVAADSVEGDMLGYSVSLRHGAALVGAPGSLEASGAAYVFTRGNDSWAQGAKLAAGDRTAGAQLGISVSLDAARALVGAYSDESLRGAAYLFVGTGDSWSEEQKLTASDGAPGHRFGNAVALDSQRALVGAYASDDSRGSVYFFSRADDAWGQRQRLVASDGVESDFFGWSVALDADHALVGAHYDDVLRGAAYLLSYGVEDRDPCWADQAPDAGCVQGSTTPRDSAEPGCTFATSRHGPDASVGLLGVLGVLAFACRRRRWTRSFVSGALAGLLALGCAGGSGDGTPSAVAGASGTGGGGPPGWDASGAGGSGGSCVGRHVVTSKRVVRLTEYQLYNAYAALFGADAAATIAADENRPSLRDRELPPISGDVGVSEGLFAKNHRLALGAMRYVAANADALTPCGAIPTDLACVQAYLRTFAERAFRHPLDDREEGALLRFWQEMSDQGASLAEALANGVYGILNSPSFVYRTELGAGVGVDGPLTPYELATAVSLFLTDGPPDDELLTAAAMGGLDTPELVRAQALRLLETDVARRNLEQAVLRYFSLARAGTVILNPRATPGFTVTSGLQASIVHEGELFLRNVLWSEPLSALLTSRRTWTTPEIAAGVYGVAVPSEVDTDGFGLVELPSDRSGLLTLSTFLLSGARSTGSSPVARGLTVNASIVCAVNQPFPEVTDPKTGRSERDPDVTSAIAALAGESELAKAQYRASTPRCAGCHLDFDAFGMVLEPYDAVGRLRAADLEGRPIDESWTTTTLPESVGGGTVRNVSEAAQMIAASGTLDRCMAMNFINYALSEVSKGGATNHDLSLAPQTGTCAVQGVIDRFELTNRSFGALMSEIAASETLALRFRGR
jgi:hypothetical protein